MTHNGCGATVRTIVAGALVALTMQTANAATPEFRQRAEEVLETYLNAKTGSLEFALIVYYRMQICPMFLPDDGYPAQQRRTIQAIINREGIDHITVIEKDMEAEFYVNNLMTTRPYGIIECYAGHRIGEQPWPADFEPCTFDEFMSHHITEIEIAPGLKIQVQPQPACPSQVEAEEDYYEGD